MRTILPKSLAALSVCAALVLAALSATPSTAQNSGKPDAGGDPQMNYQGSHVRGELVVQEEIQDHKLVNGSLRSPSISDVAAEVAGRVEKVVVQEGQQVKAGDTLVTIDVQRSIKAKASLESRKAVQESVKTTRATQLADARADVDALKLIHDRDIAVRQTQLADAEADVRAYLQAREAKPGAVSDQTLREARSNVEVLKGQIGLAEANYAQSARMAETKVQVIQNQIAEADAEILSIQAQIDELQIGIDDATVVAPFNGVVIQRHAEPGEWLTVGAMVVTLMRLDGLEAVLDVSEAVPMHVVSASKSIEIRIPALELTLNSTTHRVVPDVEPRSRRYRVIATLPSEATLAPGMSVQAYMPTNAKVSRTMVSSDALRRDGTGFFLFKVAPIGGELKALPVGVSVDFSIGQRVAVTSSELKAGDLIINEGNVRLFPMQSVVMKDLAKLQPGFVAALRSQQAEAKKAGAQGGGR